MNNAAALREEIRRDEIAIQRNIEDARRVGLDLEEKKKTLAKLEVDERAQKESQYLLDKFGLKEISRNAYIVFNKQVEFIKTVDVDKEFKDLEEFEKWLKSKKLYAHRVESFRDRQIDWYDMSLAKQLENLLWELDSKGHLIHTRW